MSNFIVSEVPTDRDSPLEKPQKASSRITPRLTRRSFLAGVGAGGAFFALSPHLRSIFEGRAQRLMCVGTFGAGDAGTLHLLQVEGNSARLVNSHPSARPAAIEAHPFQPLLYVANDVSLYQHQPRGTVETFAFDPATGKLELVGRQPLSLSATRPQSLGISPDGRSLVVAAFDGGAYNFLPIDSSGLPSAPSAILKQVGHGEHAVLQASSHPSHVVFHPQTGIAIAADYGADRLDILTFSDEISGTGRMNVAGRIRCVAGSGPAMIALHPRKPLIAIGHVLRPAIALFRIDGHRALMPLNRSPLHNAPTSICFSTTDDTLFAAQSHGTQRALLTAWSIDAQKGTLQRLSESALPADRITSMHVEDSTLWMSSDRGMIAADLGAQTGGLREIYPVPSIPNLRSMAVL